MNCRRFKNLLFDYLDGSLSQATKADAEAHLRGCPACRQAARHEAEVAQSLSQSLLRSTESLRLPSEVQHRVLSALERKRTPMTLRESIVAFWNRYARPLAVGAGLLLIATLPLLYHFYSQQAHHKATARAISRSTPSAVSIQVSYRAPAYSFRREGNLVIDTLSYETIVASGTLWASGPEHVRSKP